MLAQAAHKSDSATADKLQRKYASTVSDTRGHLAPFVRLFTTEIDRGKVYGLDPFPSLHRLDERDRHKHLRSYTTFSNDFRCILLTGYQNHKVP